MIETTSTILSQNTFEQPQPTIKQIISSIRDVKQSSLEPKYPSSFQHVVSQHKDFLNSMKSKIVQTYNKQTYRNQLLLNNRQKILQTKQKKQQQLLKALQESKSYTQSANRSLIQQIMNLQKLKSQYQQQTFDFQQKIKLNRDYISGKRKQLTDLQSEIKSYWIYNYDISTNRDNRLSKCSSYYSQVMSENTRDQETTQNYKDPISLASCRQADKENSVASRMKNFYLPAINKSSTSALSPELSFLNSSATKQKIIERIDQQNHLRYRQKLQYQREKLNLLKLFSIFLKKLQQSIKDHNEKARLERVILVAEQRIKQKDLKLCQIQKLLKQ